jgi:hypothetical protein
LQRGGTFQVLTDYKTTPQTVGQRVAEKQLPLELTKKTLTKKEHRTKDSPSKRFIAQTFLCIKLAQQTGTFMLFEKLNQTASKPNQTT